MKSTTIIHFDDEPEKLDFELHIENMLFSEESVSDSSLKRKAEEREAYAIKLKMNAKWYTIDYQYIETIEELQDKLETIALFVVDMSIRNDEEAGISIIKALKKMGVSTNKIWVLTAYEQENSQRKELSGICVEPKPFDKDDLTSRMLSHCFHSLGLEDIWSG